MEFHAIDTGTGHESVIQVTYIEQELSYLSDNIVDVSYKLFKVKFKCCTGFSATPYFFVVYVFILGMEFHVMYFTLNKINLQGNFYVGKANKAQCVFWGHFLL